MIDTLAGTPYAAALLGGVGLALAVALRVGLVRRQESHMWLAFATAAVAAFALSRSVLGGTAAGGAGCGELQLGFLTDGAAFLQVVVCAATVGAIVLVAYGRLERPSQVCAWLLMSAGALVLLCGAATVTSALVAVSLTGVSLVGLLGTTDLGRERWVGLLTSAALAVLGLFLLGAATEGARFDSLALPRSDDATGLAVPCAVLTAAGVGAALWLGWVAADSRTPAPVAAWLVVPAAAAAALALRLRLGLGVFEPLMGEAFGSGWSVWIGFGGALVAVSGHAVALRARSLAAVSAWLGVGQVGFLGLAVAGRQDATAALAFQSLALVLTQLTLFALVAVVRAELGASDLGRLGGLARRNPWLAGFLAVGLASAVGFPATAGFVGELQAIRTALSASLFVPAGLSLGAMALGAAAVIRVLRPVYFVPPVEPEGSEPLVTSSGLTIVCAAFAATTVWLGLSPGGLVAFTQQLELLQ